MTETINLPITALPTSYEDARRGLEAETPGATYEVNHFKKAVVDHVIDGDSVWLFIDLDFDGIFAHRNSRLIGIDAPDEQPEKGISGDWLRERLTPGREILVYLPKSDKYGRPLVGIYLDGEDPSLNAQSLDSGMSVPYDGGAR